MCLPRFTSQVYTEEMEKTLPNGKRKIFKDVGIEKQRTMKYELNKENLVDIFATATYGSDWLAIKRPKRFNHLIKPESDCIEEKWADVLLGGGIVAAFIYEDDEEPARKEFSLEDMEVGLKKFMEECPQDYADLVSEDGDYYTASNLMQYVLFGKVVFG